VTSHRGIRWNNHQLVERYRGVTLVWRTDNEPGLVILMNTGLSVPLTQSVGSGFHFLQAVKMVKFEISKILTKLATFYFFFCAFISLSYWARGDQHFKCYSYKDQRDRTS
jgi:hypothetical protein